MNKIEMSYLGILGEFTTYTKEQLQAMSEPELRNTLIWELDRFSSEHASEFQKIPSTAQGTAVLLGKAAIIVLLRSKRLQTDEQLAQTSTDGHRNFLIVHNNRLTNNSLSQLQSISDQQLVQMTLLADRQIDMTFPGLLKEFGLFSGVINELSEHDLHSALATQVTQFSNDANGNELLNFGDDPQKIATILGKAAIIIFLRKAGLKTDMELQQMSTAQQRGFLAKENYFHTGIPYAFLDIIPPNAVYQFMQTMSGVELVEMALGWFVIGKHYVKYNEITSAMAHDSHTGDHATTGNPANDMYKDQDRTIGQQLGSGIRTARISSTSGGDLRHSGVDFGTLADYLTVVADFLENNPNEIFTIFDECDWSDKVKSDYQEKLSHLLFQPGKDDMPSYADVAQGKWPTLQEMVSKNQRVVLMVNKEAYDENTPWRLPGYDSDNFLVSMDRDDYKWAESCDLRPAFHKVESSTRWDASNHLYMLNHYFYIAEVGVAFNTSHRAFSKWMVGDLLIEYSMLAWARTGRKPNYLNVDFYDHEEGPRNFLFDLVKAMNQPTAYGPYHVPAIIDKPIHITDAEPIQIGDTFVITCVAENDGTQFNIARAADGSHGVSLQKANAADYNQQWKLIYNTPSTGIAIVDPAEEISLYDPNAEDHDVSPDPPQPLTTKEGKGFVGAGFAMQKAGSNACYIYKNHGVDTSLWKEWRNKDMSLLDVTGRGSTVNEGDTISRWEDNGGNNQKWVFAKVTWTLAQGKLKNISVGSRNLIWGINSAGEVFRDLDGGGWSLLERSLYDGKDGSLAPFGTSLTQLSVTTSGTVYGLFGNEYIWIYDGSTPSYLNTNGRTLRSISAISSTNIWAVGENDNVYQYKGANQWKDIDGRLKQISASSDGSVWGVNKDDQIFRRVGGKWENIPGRLSYVSVGSANNVWGVNKDDEIFHYVGNQWMLMPGRLKQISAAADGSVWGVNSNDDIFWYSG